MKKHVSKSGPNLLRKFTTLFLALCMLLTAALPVSAAGSTVVDWTDENIQYIGRWNEEADCNHSYWGGAYFKVNFTGNVLKLNFTGACDIMVNVDGQGSVTFWGANGTLDVSHLLDTGKEVHTLVVNSRFDGQEMKFAGLELAEGAETQMPQTAEVIEFIGDSITSGYGNPNGASDSYSWLTASGLGYEHVQISYSGISLTDGHGYLQDFGNPSQITQYPMLQPVYYQTDALRDQLVEWDFENGYDPKAIVINMGTNDSTTGVNAETFKTNYETMLELVRDKNPNSVIFALSPFGGYFHDEVELVVETFAQADGNTYFVDTEGWLESGDYMDGIHPTNDGQIKAAQYLREELKAVIGEGSIQNTAPTIEVMAAGPHTIPEDIVLQATVRDDGLPNLNTVSTWEVVEQPEGATVTFADANAPITSARVDKAGTYVFGITADDGELKSVQKTVTVTVNEANGTVSYEAESPVNTRKGAGIYVNGAGATMVYDIGYGWNNTVQFNNVNVPEAGTYDLTFHYATENGKQMNGSVTINGGETMEVAFPAGPNWDTIMTETISVTFDKAQDNTILFGGVDGERAPNLDKITIEGPVIRPSTPDISLGSGTYHRTKTAEITCDTEGARIYYTTDGTEPTEESTPYTGPITVDQSMTLKAIAYADGMDPSKVRTAEYVIDRSLSFEAEDPMNLRQGAGLLYVGGASGEWMVYDLWTNPSNYLIFKNIDLEETGVYNMTIHYSTDANNNNMTVDVSVNDGAVQTVSFPKTAHAGDIKTVTIPNVQLNEGFNSVKLTNSSSGVNFFDRITLEKGATGEPTVTGVTVTPDQSFVNCGKTKQFSATVTGENYPAQTVTWAVSGNESAGTAIDDTGLLTVAADETATALAITATSTVDPSVSGSVTVSVAAAEEITESNIRIHYVFDNTSGNEVKDYSENGYNTTMMGTITDSSWSEDGFAFSGDNYLKVTGADLVSPNMTIVYEVMRTGDQNDAYSFFWGMNQSDWNGKGIWINSNGETPVFVATDGFAGFQTRGWSRNDFFPLNEKVEVAVTVNSETGEYAIYRNGEAVEVELNATNVTPNITVPSAPYNTIGMAGYDNEFLKNFTMSEYMIFDAALSAEDVQDVYNGKFDVNGGEDPDPETYTVTFATNGGSNIEAAEVEAGATVSRPADPTREGYTFDGWYVDEALTEAFDFATAVTEDITLYAKWIEDTVETPVCSASAAVRVEPARDENGNAVFYINLIDAENVAAVQMTFTAPAGAEMIAENDFEQLGVDVDTVVLCYLPESGGTFSCDGEVTIATITVPTANPTVKLSEVLVASYDENGDAAFGDEVKLVAAEATFTDETETPDYDINNDGTVNLLDIADAKKWYQCNEEDPNWETAKVADVDGNGKVNITDLILIVVNFS